MKKRRLVILSGVPAVTGGTSDGSAVGPYEPDPEYFGIRAKGKIAIEAKPEPLEIDLSRTAILVVDMQNAFVKKGGMLEKADRPLVGEGTIKPIQKILKVGREKNIKIIYMRYVYNKDLSDSGGPQSPNWYKESGLILMHEHPELKGKLLTAGTWDAEIIDELKPLPDDIVVDKMRYSGFWGTKLDYVLTTLNIKYLVYTGIAINVCLGTTLIDSFFREYWPILVTDAVDHIGPECCRDGLLWTIERFFGWLTTSDRLIESLSK